MVRYLDTLHLSALFPRSFVSLPVLFVRFSQAICQIESLGTTRGFIWELLSIVSDSVSV
jgi:hypothetical protein